MHLPAAFLPRDPSPHALDALLGPSPWLVLAPHDDDAMLGMGATIAAASRCGIAVQLLVATDGALGWCRPTERRGLVARRARELRRAAGALGLRPRSVRRLGYGDACLLHERGRRPGSRKGLGRQLTAALRRVRPGAVFVCNPADHNPDHQALAAEVPMALAWAGSAIWGELGAAISRPRCWQYAVYSPFAAAPAVAVAADALALAARGRALAAFRSQRQIGDLVAAIQRAGACEYFASADTPAFDPASYADAFPGLRRAGAAA